MKHLMVTISKFTNNIYRENNNLQTEAKHATQITRYLETL